VIPVSEYASSLETILESIVDAVWVYDARGRILHANRAAQMMVGIENKDEYVAIDADQRLAAYQLCDFDGNLVPREQWPITRMLKGEVFTDSERMQSMIRTFDGRQIYISISGSPLRDKRGTIIGAVSVVRDVTERALMELELEDMTRDAQTRACRMEAIIESMVEGVVVYDRDGYILQMNSAAQQMYGAENVEEYSSTPMLERAHRFQFHDVQGHAIPPEEIAIASALRSGTAISREMWLTLPGGKTKVLRDSVSPIRNSKGELDGAVNVVEDITQRKSIEQQKNEFLSIASHELRTPITALMGLADILQMMINRGQSLNTPRTTRAIREIIQQSQRLTRLIEDMIELSRIEIDQMPLQIEQNDLLEMLNYVIETQSLINKNRPLKLVVEGLHPKEGLPGYFDRDRIGQVMNNLISNAAKYSSPGSEIEVGLRYDAAHPGEALLWVKDAGVGIAADEVPHIFERFHRAGNLDRSISGFGIGLYLVHEFVTRHGGQVRVETVEGRGSTFYVYLPLQPPGA